MIHYRLRWLLTLLTVGLLATTLLYRNIGSRRREHLGPSAAEKLRDQGLNKAANENKRLLLWFSDEGSEWCQLLEQFHQEPAVAAVYARHFVELKIDVHKTPGGLILYSSMGNNRGVPAFTILDGQGTVLADSGTEDETHNVGFPSTDEQRDQFLAAIKTACPEMPDNDVMLLRAKLVEILQAHEKK
jgi:hypothetical protein